MTVLDPHSGSRFHAPVVDVQAAAATPVLTNTTITPVVLMHGLGDSGSNPVGARSRWFPLNDSCSFRSLRCDLHACPTRKQGMQSLAQSIMSKYPGSYATAVNVANGIDSIFQPMQPQVDEFAKVVKAECVLPPCLRMTTLSGGVFPCVLLTSCCVLILFRSAKLANGFNVVGLSQGGLVVRAYVQQYNDPPVHRMVSICGVQNGVFDCPAAVKIIPFVCDLFKSNPYHFLFNGSFPLSFSDYWVESMNQTDYLASNPFLAFLNNQRQGPHSAQYKANFASLERVVLVEATQDTMVYPYESEQFGGYQWGTKDTVFQWQDGDLYKEDKFGLQTLDKKKAVTTMSYKGDHLRFSNEFWNDQILPLFA